MPLGRLFRIGINQLREVEILDRMRLLKAHIPILPRNGDRAKSKAEAKLRNSLSKCGLISLAFERRGH